jgi:hypothetical protein
MNDFSGHSTRNPGVVIQTPDRSLNLGNLNDGQGLPVLFRQPTRLGPAPFPASPNYPLTDVVTEDINLFDSGITVPYADTWTIGLQRSIGRDFAVEARYVGTRSRENWATLDYNETNIFENGFVSSSASQASLRANIAAGRGTFITGAPEPRCRRSSPLPGTSSGASDAASRQRTSDNTFLTPLATYNPNPINFANSLYGDAGRRTNAGNAGIPANFFLANPDLQGGADFTTNVGSTNYHGLQLELRRRYAQGLQFQTSYAYGQALASNFLSFRRPIAMRRDVGSPGDLTHAFKATVVYDLPFGQGRRSRATPMASSIGSSMAGRSGSPRGSRAASSSTSATSACMACRQPTCRTCTSSGSTMRTSSSTCSRRRYQRNDKAYSVCATSATDTAGRASGGYLVGQRPGLHRPTVGGCAGDLVVRRRPSSTTSASREDRLFGGAMSSSAPKC